MEIVSNIALISINETMLVQLVSFLVFVFIINRVMFRPLQKTMGEREGFMESIKEDISSADLELQSLLKTSKERTNAIKEEALSVKAEVEEAAKQQATEVLLSAREEVSGISKKAEKEISDMVTSARENLQKEARQLTVTIMEKILNRRMAL
jgi:F-type H+-transporting ATPase subunit b